MENLTTPPDIPPVTADSESPDAISQPVQQLPTDRKPAGLTSKKPKLWLVVTLFVALVVLGALGYAVYRHYHTTSARQPVSNTVQQKVATPVDPYAGWKSYASSYEKLSFKYPSDWTIKTYDFSTQVTGADSAVLTSPSGTINVVWYSAVEGIGGACSVYIMPGTSPKPDDLGPCPYWYVLHKQKLASADLYYVDGVEELSDGKGYIPWCGLQASNGIVQDESNIGYMLFQAKSNHFKGSDGQDLGPVQVELACGNQFNGTIPSNGTTKSKATAFLTNPEMQQVKLILLSASYSTTGYVNINEWGVKINIADADKVTYVIGGTPNGTSANADGIISWATLKLKDSVTTNSKCQALGYEAEQLLAGTNVAKIGSYSYGFSGVSPAPCGDGILDALRTKIVAELTKDAIQPE